MRDFDPGPSACKVDTGLRGFKPDQPATSHSSYEETLTRYALRYCVYVVLTSDRREEGVEDGEIRVDEEVAAYAWDAGTAGGQVVN